MGKRETLAERLVQKVPLFFGFEPGEMKAFLDICTLSPYPRGTILCEYNSSSDRLFILLEGALDVIGADGTPLATLKPITTVGEMGFIRRQPRSATVQVRDSARVLKVEYPAFASLVESDAELRALIYRNLVCILADKLSDANDRVIRYRQLYASGQGEKGRVQAEAGTGEEAPSAAEADSPEDEERQAEKRLRCFYERAHLEVDDGVLFEDKGLYLQLRKDGYSDADIEFAIQWAVRHIPAIQSFNLVKLSISEALEDRWSM